MASFANRPLDVDPDAGRLQVEMTTPHPEATPENEQWTWGEPGLRRDPPKGEPLHLRPLDLGPNPIQKPGRQAAVFFPASTSNCQHQARAGG